MSSDAGHANHPYLSVVATARNDDHGGRLLHRLQLFVDGLAAQCDRHGLDAELILVEWNAPEDKPHLGDVIVWPESRRCSFRLIEVPPHVHAQLEHSDRLPLFQMIAKNVGIRRASGEWVLATNIDVLFSDALMRQLARRDLDPTSVYRVDRYDVADVFEVGTPTEEQLRRASEHVIRICSRDATISVPTKASRVDQRRLNVLQTFCGNLSDAAAQLFRRVRYKIAQTLRRIVGCEREPERRPTAHLHTNACGDFTLLTREAWHRLRAYPELQMFSMHLDSLLLFQAHAAGYQEHILSEPLYHIEHSSGFTPETWRDLDARINAASIRQLTLNEVLEWACEMEDQGRPLDFNDDDWGFADAEFLDYRPTAAHVA